MSNTAKCIISIAATVGIGSLGGLFTFPEIQHWYAGLTKPSWNPPNWIFGPVWTTLYLLMGIAVYRVWRAGANSSLVKSALALFIVQFVLNFFWSIIFFRYHQLLGAFVELLAMWGAIFATIIAFSKVDKLAAWLLVPYISWVSFAGILNYTIWRLN